MQKLWEVQPQGLVLVLHPGQVQLCNCNNLKVAESTNWIIFKKWSILAIVSALNPITGKCRQCLKGRGLGVLTMPDFFVDSFLNLSIPKVQFAFKLTERGGFAFTLPERGPPFQAM